MKLVYLAISLFLTTHAYASEFKIQASSGVVQPQSVFHVDFGTVVVNSQLTTRFTLRNTGNVPLTFKESFLSGADYTGTHACRNGLMPNEVCYFTIVLRSAFEGVSTGRLVLRFYEDDVVFNFYARVTRN